VTDNGAQSQTDLRDDHDDSRADANGSQSPDGPRRRNDDDSDADRNGSRSATEDQ